MTDQESKLVEEMSMPELWAEAKRLGIPKDGKKNELIERIKNAQEGGEENMPNDKPKADKTAKKPVEQTYIAKYNELRLVNRSSYTKEVAGRVVVVPGTSIQFHEGVYRTSDPDEIGFLENHPNFGNIFTKVERKDQNKAVNEVIAERYKDLEAREKEVAAKEEALRKKEMAAKGQAEGAKQPKSVEGIRSTADQPKF